ncbi:MAG: hypothetical protein ACOY71_06465 [Gemmatimonadota bacterium]
MRTIDLGGELWEVAPSGRVTQYTRDEFGLVFTRVADRQRRVLRYSPLGARNWEASLAELSDAQLRDMLRRAQPAWTSPETGYRH